MVKNRVLPLPVAQLVGVSSRTPKGCGFDSWPWLLPRIQVPSGRGAYRRLAKSLYRWAFRLGERAKLCQAGRGGPSLGLGPSSHRRKPGQHEPRLSQLPSCCVPLASSQRRPKAAVSWKRSWPSPAPRSEWLLVVIFRMSWTVGGRGSLSPALAERIMGALEYNASSSSWPQSQPVPRCGLWVAGVTVEAVGLETWVPAGRPSSFTPSVGWGWGGALWEAKPGLRCWPCPRWRPLSLHQVEEPAKGPGPLPAAAFQPGDPVPQGPFGHHSWEGCSRQLRGRGWGCPGHPPNKERSDPKCQQCRLRKPALGQGHAPAWQGGV